MATTFLRIKCKLVRDTATKTQLPLSTTRKMQSQQKEILWNVVYHVWRQKSARKQVALCSLHPPSREPLVYSNKKFRLCSLALTHFQKASHTDWYFGLGCNPASFRPLQFFDNLILRRFQDIASLTWHKFGIIGIFESFFTKYVDG